MIRLRNDSIGLSWGRNPVVLLHAFPMNHKMWAPQVRFLSEKGISSIAPDLPGFGNSGLAEADSMQAYAKRVNYILEQLNVEKAIFVGLSMGGYLSLELFRQYPEKFAGLVLANTRATADSLEVKEKRWQMVAQIEQTGSVEEVLRFHLEKFLTPASLQQNPSLKKLVWSILQEASPEAICQAQRAMAERRDSVDLLKEMRIPVKVIASKEDSLTTPEEARGMVSHIPNASIEIIEHAAHLSNMEQPTPFNEALFRLIEKCRG